MYNPDLTRDYLQRAASRLKAIEVLLAESSWADVVRESQEVVEICLKALLRSARIEVPRIHDVSGVLEDHRDRLPAGVRPRLGELARISRALRRDRELAFCGSEDLTPSQFYRRDDAQQALADAHLVYEVVAAAGS
jgi:HEPN domain-containing protein